MTTATLPADPAAAVGMDITTAYQHTEQFMHYLVHQFQRRYGGDLDELQSQAYEYFCEAYYAFATKPRGDWMGHVRLHIWYGMFDIMRRNLRRKTELLGDYDATVAAKGPGWSLAEFAQGLSDDAAMVLQLTLETPADIAAIAAAKGGEPRNIRSTIRDYLGGAGWTANRIAASFAEIKDALA